MISLPSIFDFYSPDAFVRYHASERAVRLFGHDEIIGCIKCAIGDETGAIRVYNADTFRFPDVAEQLVILRAVHEPWIVAVVDDEVPVLKAWFDEKNRQAEP
jgi:hypothetical protein